jgi:hypothetical protein
MPWRAAVTVENHRFSQGECGIKAIDPCSGPRSRSLKTRIGKKELAATAKWSVAGLATSELLPFNPFKSSSIVAAPLSTIIF